MNNSLKNSETKSKKIFLLTTASIISWILYLSSWNNKEKITLSKKVEETIVTNKKLVSENTEANITNKKEIIKIIDEKSENIKKLLTSFSNLYNEVKFLIEEDKKDSPEIIKLKNILKKIFLENIKNEYSNHKENIELDSNDVEYFSDEKNINIFYTFIETKFSSYNKIVSKMYEVELDSLNNSFAELFIYLEKEKLRKE